MIVVSNTSPLNYLVLVNAVDALATLYGQVYVPPIVLDELAHPGSPSAVRRWANAPPAWLLIRSPSVVDPNLTLHAGEAQAIALAEELGAELILMDERLGRQTARQKGITPIGVLGVLYDAAGKDLVDLPAIVTRLTTQTTFRCDKALIDDLLRRHISRVNRNR